MSLDDVRLKQQQQQAKAIAPSKALPVATYKSRDATTGDRILESPDGSKVRSTWIASTTPQETPPLVAPSTTLGIPGYAGQR